MDALLWRTNLARRMQNINCSRFFSALFAVTFGSTLPLPVSLTMFHEIEARECDEFYSAWTKSDIVRSEVVSRISFPGFQPVLFICLLIQSQRNNVERRVRILSADQGEDNAEISFCWYLRQWVIRRCIWYKYKATLFCRRICLEQRQCFEVLFYAEGRQNWRAWKF